ncbi:Asp-tRNA(Asn)/Glu-tRNA(Gln) amidotransferase subunit GatB [Patescibacteria group bacterium]|nr:MAG: Asp-tRNA(Asn)/Glu-tRNA(Gln) amidotransferase subunit GatB [Patescibacteria group bacterium]
MVLQPVIGLEIHVQLKTGTKMFCGCPAHDTGAAPNMNVCPVCLGNPGVLPVVNEEAVRMGVRMGLALGCVIAERSKFDRKHYFYPDLPKGYQISQYDRPIAEHGEMSVDVPGKDVVRPVAKIGITRAHLEEDAAKNVHGEAGKTFVDFNRAGMPLIEIVTEPDFRSPAEAKAFLTELRLMARTLRVSDADMEKGQLRCDANVSLREVDADGNVVGERFHPKTEVKNLNSFRHVERAIAYEIKRQGDLWHAGSPPAASTTRGWDDVKQKTVEQRVKEAEGDYRYFPEPDLPPLALAEVADVERAKMPELPAAKRRRFVSEYAVKPEDARQLVEDPALAVFAEQVFSEMHAWLQALPELDGAEEATWEKERARIGKLVSSWLTTKLLGALSARGGDVRTMKVDAENFAELLTLVATGKLNQHNAAIVLEEMLESGADPSHVMEDKRLGAMQDAGAIAEAVDRVLANFPAEVVRYKGGEKQLLQFLIGMVMKETEGAADAKEARNMLLVKLEG